MYKKVTINLKSGKRNHLTTSSDVITVNYLDKFVLFKLDVSTVLFNVDDIESIWLERS